jgi:hypothetical protein
MYEAASKNIDELVDDNKQFNENKNDNCIILFPA